MNTLKVLDLGKLNNHHNISSVSRRKKSVEFLNIGSKESAFHTMATKTKIKVKIIIIS